MRGAVFLTMAAIAGVALASGCASARMPLPEGLEGAHGMEVEGRQGLRVRERLRFGAYEAGAVKRSWVRGSDWRILVFEREKRDQTFSFTLAEGGDSRWRADCRTRLRTRGIEIGGVEMRAEDRSALDCSLLSTDGERWILSLTEQRDSPLAGTLSSDGRSFEVAGSNRLEGSRLPVEGASGYELRDGDRVAAAIEVLNDGRVWIVAPHDQALLAATAAALLLVEDLRATLT
jgi:hypothetical protein